jgi:hypothetical protein
MVTSSRAAAGAAFALCVVLGCGERGGERGGERPGLTYANYERIKDDGSMTEEDVNQLMGSKGEDAAGLGKHVAGVFAEIDRKMRENLKKGGAKTPVVRTLRWGTDNRHVICTITDGKVTAVRQQGL